MLTFTTPQSPKRGRLLVTEYLPILAAIFLLRPSFGEGFHSGYSSKTVTRHTVPFRDQIRTMAGHADNEENVQPKKSRSKETAAASKKRKKASTATTKSKKMAKDEEKSKAPMCNCNRPACQRSVRKEGPNQGRKFWGCAKWPKEGCKFFEWDDASATATVSSTNVAVSQEKQSEKEKGEGFAIKMATLNVANFQPHNLAPRGFDPRLAFERELKRQQPDILALQELPQPAHYNCFLGYQCIGSAQSHCGFVGLYIRDGFLTENVQEMARIVPRADIPGAMSDELPVVLGSILLDNGKEVAVGSCHLEPYKDSSNIRKAQLNAISKATAHKPSLILGGDMNMRNSEDAAIEKVGGWKDAWKEAGSERREAYTWNSKINRYHGEDGFRFHCRFDRVYARGANVESFSLMANEPMKNNSGDSYYLSDHFGISTTVLI